MLNLLKKRNGTWKSDILSGITVALALVPEAVAFSFVAGVEPSVGLFSAFTLAVITGIMGGRPGMISGSTATVAVVVAPLVASHGVEYMFAAIALAGVIQMLAGILKWGKFMRLMPHSATLGFINGLAIIIFLSQFESFKQPGAHGHHEWLPATTLLLMGGLIALTMGIMWALPKLTKAVPSALVAILVVTAASFGIESLGFDIPSVTEMAGQPYVDMANKPMLDKLPRLHIPQIPMDLPTLKLIFSFALPVAAVALMESLMTLSLIDEITKTRGRGNRECLAQGVANLSSGMLGGMGGCAMIGQSMMNMQAGGRGRTSCITSGLGLLVFILVGSKWIGYIPTAALVGVMFMVVVGTFEWTSLRILHKIPRHDALVLVAVSVVTVFTNLAVAAAVGIIISALVFAWEKGKHISAATKFDEHGTKIYKLDGPLFFGSAKAFIELFDLSGDPDDIVIDFKRSRLYDHSALDALHALTEKYAEAGKNLHLLNLSQECVELLGTAKGVVEVSVIEDLDWHLAVDELA